MRRGYSFAQMRWGSIDTLDPSEYFEDSSLCVPLVVSPFQLEDEASGVSVRVPSSLAFRFCTPAQPARQAACSLRPVGHEESD